MPVEISYHPSCDKCGTYASWSPLKSYALALDLTRLLGWYVYDLTDPKNPGKASCVIQCVDCRKEIGKLS
jgi:hypothetical protein